MNLKKIKKMLKSKKGILVSGVIVGIIVVGIIGGVLVSGVNKSNNVAENNKSVISNKKEDITKDKGETKLSEKENDKSEDKTEEVKENEPDINIAENSTSSNDVNNNNTNKNNNQPTSSKNNSSNNNSSNNTSGNNGSSSNNTSTSNGSTHTHNWNPITDQVYHDEVGHWEDVVLTPAWTENVPVYEERELSICNGCGKDITNDPWGHIEEQMLQGNISCGGYHSQWQQVQVGTNAVNHPAVTEKKWVVDKAAWTETVTTGYSCSCGATK